MSYASSEADAIFNRANLAVAKSQRLVASWLPASLPSDSSNVAEISGSHQRAQEQEESEIFVAAPEQ